MKKFLLMLAGVAMAMTANAYEFCYRGIPINNGDRINITEYWDQTMNCFDPELTLKSATGGSASVGVSNIVSEVCEPELGGFDGFDYCTGIGNPGVSICSLDGQCVNVAAGKSLTKTGVLEPDVEYDLRIEQTYTVGIDETSIDDMNLKASFDVTVNVAGEITVATFYVDHVSASVAGINSDMNAPVEYFDLQGRSIAEPANGIFIKRQGSKVTKVVR